MYTVRKIGSFRKTKRLLPTRHPSKHSEALGAVGRPSDYQDAFNACFYPDGSLCIRGGVASIS